MYIRLAYAYLMLNLFCAGYYPYRELLIQSKIRLLFVLRVAEPLTIICVSKGKWRCFGY